MPVRAVIRAARSSLSRQPSWAAVLIAVIGLLVGAGGARAAVPSLTGTVLAAPAEANASGASADDFPQDASCGGDGDCVAVGTYLPGQSGHGLGSGRANLQSSGTWQAGTEPSLPGDAATDAIVAGGGLVSVSCPAAGRCIAVGTYDRNDPQCFAGHYDVTTALSQTLTGGDWSPSESQAPMNACNTEVPTEVACASASWCTAIGQGADQDGTQYMWMGTGTVDGLDSTRFVATPSHPSGAEAAPAEVACASQSLVCIATGIDDGGGASDQEPNMVMVGADGQWGAARAIPTPDSGDTDAVIQAVACSASTCYGTGSFVDANGDTRGLIISSAGGEGWATSGLGGGQLVAISCGQSSCAAEALPPATCGAAGSPCVVTTYSDQAGSWIPIGGEGLGAVYECSHAGACFATAPGGAVYELTGDVGTKIGQEQAPGDCDTSGGEGCGGGDAPVTACAATTCVSVQPYTTTGGEASAVAYTLRATQPLVGSAVKAGLTLTCTPNPATVGATVTCTVTAANPVAGSAQRPTGTVTIGTGSPADPSCTLTAATAGQASCSVSFAAPSAGTATIVAAYAGDGTFAPGTTSTTETVLGPTQTPDGGGSSDEGTAGPGAGGGSPSTGTAPRPSKAAVGGLTTTGTGAVLTVSCPAKGATCQLTATMTVTAPTGHAGQADASREPLALASATETVSVATARLRLAAGHHGTLRLALDRAGRRLLSARHRLHVTIVVRQGGLNAPLMTRTLTLHAPGHPRR